MSTKERKKFNASASFSTPPTRIIIVLSSLTQTGIAMLRFTYGL